jgi:hypothetical protein
MRGGKWIDEVAAQRPHARQSGRLVRPDHGGITDNIGRDDGSQTTVRLAHPQYSVEQSLRRRHPLHNRVGDQ